ncbi:MAG: methyl-accepting chemotaxis protein [Syntrophales bacterium]|nr:methyl-accepting chemotaxis protein [Syntrophales bacterium]
MFNFKNMSIGKKLTGGAILLLVIVSAGIGILSYVQASRALQTQVEENIPLMARDASKLIRSTLDRHLAVVTELAGNPDIRSMDWDRQLPVLEGAIARLGYFQFGVVLPDGNITLNDGAQTNVRDRAYFREAISGRSDISDVFMHRVLNRPVMTIAVPIREGREVSGILLAILDATWLSETTDTIGYGARGYSYIIDGNGTMIAHANRDFVRNQTNFIEEARTNSEYAQLAAMFQRMTRGESGFDEYPFMGSHRFFGYAPVEGMSWSIAVGAHKADVFEGIAAMRWNILIVSLVCIFVGILLVTLLSRSITKPLNRAIEILSSGAEQVSAASREVASASQSLAEGASEQASGIEETSSSLEEMSSMTKQNSENSGQARSMMAEASDIVAKGNAHMNEMAGAIKEIIRSSEETGKIIKTIDEIAFQTNLLALNAAVEAARAGEAGAGFAVVADEVRNLAMRAGEAAKNTSDLIENTIKAVRKGSDLTELTQQSYKDNVEISGKVAELVNEIAAASEEQSQGIDQINRAVHEMDKVTQQNAANAEESASAAEEMNAQSEEMKIVVQELVAMAGGSGGNGLGSRRSLSFRRARSEKASGGNSETGKAALPEPGLRLPAKQKRTIPLDDDEFRSF